MLAIRNTKFILKNIPTCVDWLQLNETGTVLEEPILVSCDIKGNIFKYNLNKASHTRYFPENKPIVQLKACPNSYLIAVG